MPDFFLTLIANEAKLSTMGGSYIYRTHCSKTDASFTWMECLVKCASMFYARLQKILYSYILSGPRILGSVEGYMVRYEIQFCGSLHAHIILWIENSDVEHVANEIIVTVSAEFDTTMKKNS